MTASTCSSSARPLTCISRCRSGALPRKPLVYQLACLRKARIAGASPPSHAASRRACSSITSTTSPRLGGLEARGRRRRREVAEQPRPAEAAAADDDAVAAGVRIIRSASSASQMSPLPSTGMRAPRASARQSPPSAPRRRRAARRCGRAARPRRSLPPRRSGRRRGRSCAVVDADPELERDRHGAGVRDRRADDRPQQLRLERDRGAAALARHLAHRAAEVHVDVVDAALADESRTASPT